jgi:hypothetical protein
MKLIAGLASDYAAELGCANNEDAQTYTACQSNPHDPCSAKHEQIDLRHGFMMANIGPRARLTKLQALCGPGTTWTINAGFGTQVTGNPTHQDLSQFERGGQARKSSRIATVFDLGSPNVHIIA